MAAPSKTWKGVQVAGFILAAWGAIAFSTDNRVLAPVALLGGVVVWGFGRFMQWWTSG